MKITAVRTRPYMIDLARPLGDANTPHGFDSSAGLAVFVDSDEGVTGVAPGAPGSDAAIAALSTLIVGRDPRGVRGLWQKMVNASFKGGNEGAANGAISSLDVALWDLKAKLNGEPLWKTLGASSRRVRAYASGIDMCLNDEDMAAFYRGKAAAGVSGGKLKVGIDLEADLRRTGVMKEALETSGKPAELMVDSNEYWSAEAGDPQHLRVRGAVRPRLVRGARAAMGLPGTAEGVPECQGGGRHRREPEPHRRLHGAHDERGRGRRAGRQRHFRESPERCRWPTWRTGSSCRCP